VGGNGTGVGGRRAVWGQAWAWVVGQGSGRGWSGEGAGVGGSRRGREWASEVRERGPCVRGRAWWWMSSEVVGEGVGSGHDLG
jgi:hypothetical protein